MDKDHTQNSKADRSDGIWAHTPALPLSISPYLRIPSPASYLTWLYRSWLPITERLIILLIALASWKFLTPSLEQTATFQIGWIAIIYAKNFALMLIIAGGLHLYLYHWHAQTTQLKFDRSMANKNSSRFTFGNQLRDNMFWSLASGVTIWTGFETLLLWAHANGYGTLLFWPDNPVLFLALFILIPLWNSLWFFCIHRLLHWPPLYRLFHHVHHRNISVGPWSGNSMHPVEHLIWLAGALIYLPIVCHPVHFIFSQQLTILGAITSHSGYEGLIIGGKKRLRLGDFFHQLHHRFYDCNYGTAELGGLDKLHGSYHDGQTPPEQMLKKRKKAS